jgi:hypothetical protein
MPEPGAKLWFSRDTVRRILLTIENVGTVSGVQGLDASYIIVKLHNGMPSGNLSLTVTLRGVMSTNSPTLEISP